MSAAVDRLLRALSGHEFGGGCDDCDAYQTASEDELGVFHFTVHHDDWCPFLAAWRRGADPSR